MRPTLRLALFLLLACAAIPIFSTAACAQQIDVAGGGATFFAPSASGATGNHQNQSLDGGTYPVISADFLFFKNRTVGVEGEFSWRLGQSVYAPGGLDLDYRPLFYNVNAIWVAKVTKRFSLEVLGGMGAQSTRFYTGSGYAASNHLLFDGGGGIKFYAWRHFFFRPEARYYVINNNLEFSSSHALRYGASIGYTFRQRKDKAPQP